MIFVALAALALAILVAIGRRPLMARSHGRPIALALAAAAGVAALYDALRGGWIGGSILLTAALWLAAATRRPRLPEASDMGVGEAASMLGVSPDADREEIEAAYRRLMFRVHPDQGGAAGLAAQINAARAVLLARR